MKTANSTAVGLFVVIGLAFVVGGVVLFSSGSLFRPEQRYILYFDGSLDGLNRGAPVKFRGVTVGRVEEVLIRHNQATNDFVMPVIVVVDKKLAQSKSDTSLQLGDQDRVNVLISHGFRGRLEAESLVTGNLYVGMDFVRDAPPPVFHQVKPQYQEIPTVPSQVQQLLSSLAHLDLPGLQTRLNTLLDRANTCLNQLNFVEINSGLTNLLGSANQFITGPDLTNAVRGARVALDDAQALLNRLNGRIDPLVDNVNVTLADAQKTLAELRGAFQKLSGMLGPDAAFRADLSQTLEQLSNASRAIADLAEFLQRNPDSLLMGRKQPKE